MEKEIPTMMVVDRVEAMRNAALAWVQYARENGESDMRQLRGWIQGIDLNDDGTDASVYTDDDEL